MEVRQTPAALGRAGVLDSPTPSRQASPSRVVDTQPLPVYYPGTAEPQAATRLRVEAGAELSGVDIVAVDVAPVTVSGEVRFDGDRVASEATVQIERIDLVRQTGRFVMMQDDRSFTVSGIAPGRYAVSARTVRFEGRSGSMSGRTVDRHQHRTRRGRGGHCATDQCRLRAIASSRRGSLGSQPLVVRVEPADPQAGTGEFVRVAANGSSHCSMSPPAAIASASPPAAGTAVSWSVQGVSVSGRDLPDEILAVFPGASVTGVMVQLGAR